MKEALFVEKNNQLWRSLEDSLGRQAISFQEISSRMTLYRVVSGHLSYARAHYPGSSLCGYLEGLTARTHAAIYAHSAKGGGRRRGIVGALSLSLRRSAPFLWASAAIFLLAALVSFGVGMARPEYLGAFLPEQYRHIEFESLNSGQEDLDAAGVGGSVMSSSIMVNNIRVSVLAFGLGLTCGVGTVYVLLMNGAMLGALASLYTVHGRALFFWSIILPHGVWELCAIALAGGAGLCLGYSLIRPGPYRRVDALLTAARSVLAVIGLVTVMLVVAAAIEGFFTPAPLPAEWKLLFSALTAVPLVWFFVWVARRPQEDPDGIGR